MIAALSLFLSLLSCLLSRVVLVQRRAIVLCIRTTARCCSIVRLSTIQGVSDCDGAALSCTLILSFVLSLRISGATQQTLQILCVVWLHMTTARSTAVCLALPATIDHTHIYSLSISFPLSISFSFPLACSTAHRHGGHRGRQGQRVHRRDGRHHGVGRRARRVLPTGKQKKRKR